MRSLVATALRSRSMLASTLASTLALASLVLAGPLGCASSMGSSSGSERVVVAVDAPPARTSSDVVVTETLVAPAAQEPATGRRRLSQTITLGQGTTEPIYAAPPAQPGAASGGNVTVNNNVTVVNQPPVMYGGYGYGYGAGYGGARAAGGARDGRGVVGTGASRSAWAPNGWEGAQRTAAPGRTPGVGGNFAPAPSFGPAPMR